MSRPKGSKNKRTEQWDKMAHYIINGGSKKLLEIMDAMPSDEYVRTYLVLLQYFKPKQQSTQLKQEGGISLNVISTDLKLLEKI